MDINLKDMGVFIVSELKPQLQVSPKAWLTFSKLFARTSEKDTATFFLMFCGLLSIVIFLKSN